MKIDTAGKEGDEPARHAPSKGKAVGSAEIPRRKLMKAYKEGKTAIEIAIALGVKGRVISKLWKGMGLTAFRYVKPEKNTASNGSKPAITPQELTELHARRMTATEAAAELGVHKTTVSYHWKRMGLKPLRDLRFARGSVPDDKPSEPEKPLVEV